MKKLIKVGIIDIDESSREQIKNIIQRYNDSQTDVQVNIIFSRPRLSTLKTKQSIVPDILILDIRNQDVRIAEKIKSRYPDIDVVIVTQVLDTQTARTCFRDGAVSYLIKQSCIHLLPSALITSIQGGSYVSPQIARALINRVRDTKRYEELLTTRELQVANGLIEGMSYKMIAHHHELSLDTVRIYIKRVYRKLNINSKGELIAQMIA